LSESDLPISSIHSLTSLMLYLSGMDLAFTPPVVEHEP
jgi:hypothetical protein